MKTVFTGLVSTLVLSACAGGYTPQYQIKEIKIVNNSNQPLRDVSIRASQRVLDCAEVAPLGICSDRFGRRKFHQHSIEVEWMPGDGPRRSESLPVDVPATFSTGLPLSAEIQVDPQGGISVRYRQESGV